MTQQTLVKVTFKLGHCTLITLSFIYQEKEKIKDIIESLREGELFCDPDFSAEDATLFFCDTCYTTSDIEWKRPQVNGLMEWDRRKFNCSTHESVKASLF